MNTVFLLSSVLTSTILAQTPTDGTTGGGADDESSGDMYEELQTCLENEERSGGTIGFVLEGDIRACFIDAGYIQDNEVRMTMMRKKTRTMNRKQATDPSKNIS